MEKLAKRPLKKSLTGFGVDLFIINREGYVIGEADKLLREIISARRLIKRFV